MPDIAIKQIDELERYTGPFQKGQDFFFRGKSLNLSKISMNAIKVTPHWCTERRECARQRIKGMKPAKRRKDKLIRLDDFDSETGREGRASLTVRCYRDNKNNGTQSRKSKMHRRPPSGGGKRNNRLALLTTVISIRATSQRARIKRASRYVYCLPRGVYAANYLPNPQNRYSCRANFSFIVNAACLKLRPTMIHFEARGKVAASNSTNAVSFSPELITNRSPSPRCALAIQIIRPSESMVETQPKLHPALWRSVLHAVDCACFSLQTTTTKWYRNGTARKLRWQDLYAQSLAQACS